MRHSWLPLNRGQHGVSSGHSISPSHTSITVGSGWQLFFQNANWIYMLVCEKNTVQVMNPTDCVNGQNWKRATRCTGRSKERTQKAKPLNCCCSSAAIIQWQTASEYGTHGYHSCWSLRNLISMNFSNPLSKPFWNGLIDTVNSYYGYCCCCYCYDFIYSLPSLQVDSGQGTTYKTKKLKISNIKQSRNNT